MCKLFFRLFGSGSIEIIERIDYFVVFGNFDVDMLSDIRLCYHISRRSDIVAGFYGIALFYGYAFH